MKLTKCENKHFYDADKYDVCPHCESEENAQSAPQVYSTGPSAKPRQSTASMSHSDRASISSSSLKKGTLSPHTGSIWEQNADQKTASFMDEFATPDEALDETPDETPQGAPGAKFCAACGTENNIAAVFCGKCGKKTSEELPDKPPEAPTPNPIGEHSDVYGIPNIPEPAPLPAPPPVEPSVNSEISAAAPPAPPATPPPVNPEIPADDLETHAPITPIPQAQESLQSQVNAVASHGPTEDMKTIAFYNFEDAQPVVGWLVCVSGEYFGQSFNIKSGQNFIGRALTMDIPLAKDTSVSRNKHAIITYDPQNRVFFIQPGESSGLTYHKGKLLLAYQPLNSHEEIKVGNSEFIFIPCCGEKFKWEDYIQQ